MALSSDGRLALGRREPQRVADSAPDQLGIVAGVERLVNGAVGQTRKNLVASPRVGICRTEVVFHPPPEFGQPHAARTYEVAGGSYTGW